MSISHTAQRCFGILTLLLLTGVHASAGDAILARRLGQGESIRVVLAPRRKAVLSAEVPTTVKVIHKEFGQPFKRESVLIALDSRVYKANLKSAKSILSAAEANFKATEVLYMDKAVSQVELINARRDYNVAIAKLEVAQKELDACTIKAPYAGRVVKLHVQEHELVQQGQPLVAVVDDRVLRAQFLLPSRLYTKLSLGQSVKVHVSEVKTPVVGKVSHISATIDPVSATFEVYAEVPNDNSQLSVGMTGHLRLSDIQGESEKSAQK